MEDWDANQLVEAKQLGEAHMLPQAISLLILLRSSYSKKKSNFFLKKNNNIIFHKKNNIIFHQNTVHPLTESLFMNSAYEQ